MVSSSNSIVINKHDESVCRMKNEIQNDVQMLFKQMQDFISILCFQFGIGLKRWKRTRAFVWMKRKTFQMVEIVIVHVYSMYGAHENMENGKVYYEFSVKWSKIYVAMINEA